MISGILIDVLDYHFYNYISEKFRTFWVGVLSAEYSITNIFRTIIEIISVIIFSEYQC